MPSVEIYRIVVYVTSFSITIPILFSILRFKALNKTLRALFIYLILSFSSDIITLFTSLYYPNLTNIILNTFTIIETVAICIIYLFEMRQTKERVLIYIGLLIVLSLAIETFLFEKGLNRGDNVVSPVEAGIFMLVSTIYFYKLFIDPKISKLGDHYFYWVNLSFLIYFSVSFILFMFNEFIERCEQIYAILLWGVHQLILITCNILFLVAIWKNKTTRRYS